jgi:hypothetical protein
LIKRRLPVHRVAGGSARSERFYNRNSVGSALIRLKNHISTIYEGYTSKKNLDSERTREFKVFETAIVRRHFDLS